MKVLFAIGSMKGGGAERVMSIIAPALANQGYNVLLASNFNGIAYPLAESVRRFNIFRKKSWLGLSIVGEVFRLIQLLRRERPDIVVSFLSSASLRMFFARFFIRVPWIVSEHSSFEQKLGLKSKILRCFVPKKADCVVLLSEIEANIARVFFKKVFVIPNPSRLPTSSVLSRRREKSICLCGDLSRYEQKGFDRMIQHWPKVIKHYPEWKLILVGGENTGAGGREYLENVVQQLGLSDSVVFAGRRNDMAEIFASVQIYVSCSQVECFPMALIEAMSQGCVCVAFANSGPRAIICDGDDGFLVERENWDGLIDKICKVVGMSQVEVSTISKNAQTSAAKYEINEVVRRWKVLLEEFSQ